MTSPIPGLASPVEATLFASLDPLRLAGSRCLTCGTTTFPAQLDCPRCATRTMTDVALPTAGTLWTWTVQAFEPKAPYVSPTDGFAPFAVGYVDLGDVIVESVLLVDPADVAVGMSLKLVPHGVRTTADASGLGYAFAAPGGAR